jgi:hypothetical protein
MWFFLMWQSKKKKPKENRQSSNLDFFLLVWIVQYLI